MENVTVVRIKNNAEQFHPEKADKYFRVVETLSSAYRVLDCSANSYHIFAEDVNVYVWLLMDWQQYCGR